MIVSTRVHGAIDYSVAAMLGGLATMPALNPRVRRLLGVAGASHAGYSALTDYEAGIRPVLSMQTHLVLDALGGAALVAAGMTMRRVSPAQRALLVGIGLSELSVVAISSAAPVRGPGQGSGPVSRVLEGDEEGDRARAGYPPLDAVKQVAEGVWVVDSTMAGPFGSVLPVRMTVLRLEDGGLLLHSPTRLTPSLLLAVRELGPVRHLVAPNVAHWVFVRDWQRACPDATTWAAPGVRARGKVRRSGLRLDAELGDAAPAAWGAGMVMIPVRGGLGFVEAALFHAASGTLVLTDLAVNIELAKVPAAARPLIRALGMDGRPAAYLRALVRLNQAEAAAAARRLVALAPRRVVFAHGQWVGRSAGEALGWLIGPG